MVEKQEQESAAAGVVDFIYRTIYGLLLSTGLVILNNVIDFFWGSQIIQIYITITSSIILSIYFIFHKFSKVSFVYLLGWIIGLFILYKIDLSFFSLSMQQLVLWVVLPVIILIVRGITNRKRGN